MENLENLKTVAILLYMTSQKDTKTALKTLRQTIGMESSHLRRRGGERLSKFYF